MSIWDIATTLRTNVSFLWSFISQQPTEMTLGAMLDGKNYKQLSLIMLLKCMHYLKPCSAWYFIPSYILIVIKASTRNIFIPFTAYQNSITPSCLIKNKMTELSLKILFLR